MTVMAMSQAEAAKELEKVLDENRELFSQQIGRVTHYAHKIEVTSDAPFKAKTYPIPEVHRSAVMKHITELEQTGIIQKAATQYINPLVAVVKKTGEIRCLDAREINKRMANDHAQPPTIDEVFQRFGHRKIFTTLDVTKAFWQIPLEKKSRKYTGFMAGNQSCFQPNAIWPEDSRSIVYTCNGTRNRGDAD